MADEVQYASGPDSATNKRKYGDQTPPPSSSGTQRATGFSAPIASQSPDSGHALSSYNSIPPPAGNSSFRWPHTLASMASYSSFHGSSVPAGNSSFHGSSVPAGNSSFHGSFVPLGPEDNPNSTRDIRDDSLYSRKAIEFYNDKHGTNYKFVKIKEAFYVPVARIFFFITFEATDEDKDGGQCKTFNAGILLGVLSEPEPEPEIKFCDPKRITSGKESMASGHGSPVPVGRGNGRTYIYEGGVCTYIYEGGMCNQIVQENGEVLLWDDIFEKTP